MNKIYLIGNLTRDPELQTTPSGVPVCKFSIAVNRNYSNAQGEREADFFNIVVWRALGENCAKFLSKGKKVAVCGSIQMRNYEDKEGNKRQAVDVTADDVEFLTPKSEFAGASEPPMQTGSGRSVPAELKPIESEDLPF